MFDYASNFAATGSIGGYSFSVGQAYPSTYQTYYPTGYSGTAQVTYGQQDNTMLYVLLAVVAVILITR